MWLASFLKGLFVLLGDLISVRKEEFKFNSRYFNPKKLLLLVILVLSILLNITFGDKVLRMNAENLALVAQIAELESKIKPNGSSDSGNGLKPKDNWMYQSGYDSFILP